MHKIMTIFGTRPEAIKLAPVVRELARHPDEFDSIVGVTGQHDELLTQVLQLFDIRPRFNLKVMQANQGLSDLTAVILKHLGAIFKDLRPDLLLIQGDTTTVFAAALAAFYQKIRIGHVEAGLRTEDKYQPYPEEINRRLTDQMSDLFFAPTAVSRDNLLGDGIAPEKIHITGNTVVDALHSILRSRHPDPAVRGDRKMILITAHRRENFGRPLENILSALRKLSDTYPEVDFVFPVHPNPNIGEPVRRRLGDAANIRLLPPLDYMSFVDLMERAYVILTDSGGVQEEAPTLAKPVLILRQKTERPEVVCAGGARLVGTDPGTIVQEVSRLLQDPARYRSMARAPNPYGDGTAAKKIVRIIADYLGRDHPTSALAWQPPMPLGAEKTFVQPHHL